MNPSVNVPTAGSLLRWGGLFAVVLAIVVGIMGMHVIGGAQAGAMLSSHVSSAVTNAAVTAAAVPVVAHHGPAQVLQTATDPAAGSAAPGHQRSSVKSASPSLGCDASMANHAACTPFTGAAPPAAPQPGLVPDPAADPTVANRPGSNPADRAPDRPSLTQLSISRT